MKHLRQYIRQVLNENKLSGRSLQGVLNLLEGYASNTWIFFDTETTGLEPSSSQLTEIAAIAVDPNTWNSNATILDQFNEKIKLTPASDRLLNDPGSSERKAWEKSNKTGRHPMKDPQAILSMTRYGEQGRAFSDEQIVLDEFFEWAASFSNPMFIAQNASFDLKFLNVRSAGKLPKYPVLDTKQLMEMYLIPLLKTQAQAEQGDTASRQLLDKLYVKRGNWGFHSTSMGVVSKAYGISVDGWHNALVDVKMMMSMYKNVVNTLKDGMEIDISKEHGKVINAKKRRMYR
tara:strand:+ start:2762 stop:3628 length:867 start_codon:yes stop_codon:yes gene_type:complete